MPQYDTCYYWSGEACIFSGECEYESETGECLAEDEDLLTYEDYLQSIASSEVRTDAPNQKVKTDE